MKDSNLKAEAKYIKPVRFAVRSLGWIEIAEEDLTPEKSSRAVNKAIVDLSTGRNDIMDNISKWGDVSSYEKLSKLYSIYMHISQLNWFKSVN